LENGPEFKNPSAIFRKSVLRHGLQTEKQRHTDGNESKTRNKSITSKAVQYRQDIVTRICCLAAIREWS